MRRRKSIKRIRQDKRVALLFLALTVAYLFAITTNSAFFEWAFERHHNQWSWYIRPFFLIPFCFFAYKHSWTGLSVTIFCLLTSMFWFNKPEVVSEQVKAFLQYEKDWLYGEWDVHKIILLLAIPASLLVLGIAFWKRRLFMGLGVVFLMAAGKVVWSIYYAGESGRAIMIPAIVGLIICSGVLFYGFTKLEKRKRRSP